VLVGTSYLVGRTAIGDALSISIGVGALAAALLVMRLPDALLVAVGAVIGLIAYPLLQPQWLLH